MKNFIKNRNKTIIKINLENNYFPPLIQTYLIYLKFTIYLK